MAGTPFLNAKSTDPLPWKITHWLHAFYIHLTRTHDEKGVTALHCHYHKGRPFNRKPCVCCCAIVSTCVAVRCLSTCVSAGVCVCLLVCLYACLSAGVCLSCSCVTQMNSLARVRVFSPAWCAGHLCCVLLQLCSTAVELGFKKPRFFLGFKKNKNLKSPI